MALDNAGNESHQKRHGLLKDLVRIFKKKNSDRHEIVPILEPLSFDKGFFVVIRACQLLAQKNDGIILVGVAGPSGAGKTVFTEKILNFMPSIAVISMDNYNDSSRIVDGNFDDPRLTDYDTLLENVRDLKEGKQVEVPIYDFKSNSRVGYRTLEVPSSRIVIIEGIYALSERLRSLLDLRISVTGGVHFDLVKRVLRDIQRAGQEPEEIIYQISETVYPMYKAFIEPDLQTAHIKIMNKFNPFTGFQSPTYILKSARNVTVDQIKTVFSEDYAESKEETYDIFLLPPGEDPESCQSYLRMRNKDGKYSLMFEEWVTDNPFVISPRITFEVSVRLLGGLMALGYTIATILKRSSHVFSDDRVCVKIDWLEQLKRQYIQLGLVLGYKTPGPTSMLTSQDNFYLHMTRKIGVTMLLKDSDNSFEVIKIELPSHVIIKKVQGKDRMVVKFVAEQLGLDGSYTPRTYIEQIQLEKLINEVMALPDDLRTKLSLDEDLCLSPREALSKASADRVASRNKHQKSGLSQSYTMQRDKTFSKITAANYEKFDRRNNESSTLVVNEGIITQLSEQISSLNDRMDVFTTCIEELNSKLVTKKSSPGQQNSALQAELCNGSAPNSFRFYNGSFAGSVIPNSSSSSHLAKESPLMEEISVIARGQRQLMHQLDSLSKLMRENLVEPCRQVRPKRKNIIAYSERFPIPVILTTVAVGSIGMFLVYKSRSRN